MPLTAVLDVGKTNVKVLVFDGPTIVWRRAIDNPVQLGPPYPHHDTEAIWRFCLASLRDAASAHPIDTITVTTHGASITLAGPKGLAAPVMDYEFSGPEELAAEYDAVRPSFGETLTPAMPNGLNWARQVFYVQRRHPELFAQATHILTYPQFWGLLLTGTVRNEVTSFACHGDGWNPRAGCPSSLFGTLGWSPLLPPMASAWEEIGPLRPEAAAAAGLSPRTRVVVGVHDSNASLIPYLLTTPTPFTVISTGTWVVLVALGASVEAVSEAAGTMANVDVLGRAGPSARFMGGREYAALTEGASAEADAADLAAVLGSGAMALPSFAPDASPIRDEGRIVGTLPDRPGTRAALASLYLALMADHQLDVLGAGMGPIIIDGTFARNGLFCGVLAALRSGQAVRVDRDVAGAAYGASLLANWPAPPDQPPLPTAVPWSDVGAILAHRDRWRYHLSPAARAMLPT